MAWEVEYTDTFGEWWDSLNLEEQKSVAHVVGLLEEQGPNLKRPYADVVHGSCHAK